MTVEFTIVDQTHEWVYGTQGTRTGQWIITFQTPAGVQSQVIVGDTLYTPANVAKLIAEEVGKIDKVQALTHGDETPREAHRPVTEPRR